KIIKQQKLEGNVNQEILSALRRNMTRCKNKYIIYTDGAVNTRTKKKVLLNNMGIGWVQTNETQEWPEEEVALSFEGWPSSTIAELVAVWAALLTIPEEKQVEIYTDSNATIRNISRGLEQVDRKKILEKRNAIWILKIIYLIKSKNIQIELVKIKSHSRD